MESEQMTWTKVEALGSVRTGCMNCAPKPALAPLDWCPHPGFGQLKLTCDGDEPDWWREFCDFTAWEYHINKGWYTIEVAFGPHKGEVRELFDGDWLPIHLDWDVTLAEIEECVAVDPDHDWRLEIHGAMGGVVYQRHDTAEWVAIERLDGFA